MTERHAIYFAPPPGSELESFGRRIVGRDHLTGKEVQQMDLDGLSGGDLWRITKSARHYGFHATLKAPFELREGCTENELLSSLETFAARRTAFRAPPLQISALSRWIAFMLSAPCPDMNRLASDCVRDFEPFRAPLDLADIDRRRQSRLTARQDEQMLAYGYPYIFDDFQFHMTLAGPLEEEERDRITDMLQGEAGAMANDPLLVDAITLYQQPDRDRPFIQKARFPFQPL